MAALNSRIFFYLEYAELNDEEREWFFNKFIVRYVRAVGNELEAAIALKVTELASLYDFKKA